MVPGQIVQSKWAETVKRGTYGLIRWEQTEEDDKIGWGLDDGWYFARPDFGSYWAIRLEESEIDKIQTEHTYLFKGVGKLRLQSDLQERYMPVGIRSGSATALAIGQGRRPTELDKVTLWFGLEETAKSYCQKQSSSILLRIRVLGHPVIQSGADYYTKVPVDWGRVEYFTDSNQWAQLRPGPLPKNAKDFSEDESDDDNNEEEFD